MTCGRGVSDVMKMNVAKAKIIEVFTDVRAHRVIADLIRKYSTNKNDVREAAIDGLTLSDCREILDLGCGFGFYGNIEGKSASSSRCNGCGCRWRI